MEELKTSTEMIRDGLDRCRYAGCKIPMARITVDNYRSLSLGSCGNHDADKPRKLSTCRN